jgi:glycosyltransferase involved in cell wall biosynthesis
MNVAFVNSTHRWGGVKSWTLRVAQGLARRDHRVVLFLRRDDPFRAACADLGLRAEPFTFGPDWNPWAVRKLRRRLREGDAQAVITNVSKDNRIAGPACRSVGLPVLMRVGGSGDITDTWRVRWEQRRYVTRIVVPARAIQESLLRFPWMRAGERVEVIPNGVDLEQFRPGSGKGALRGELDTAPSVPLVVATCQLTVIKGLDVLLQALARLRLPPPQPEVVLIGKGKDEERLRRLAHDLGISDRVHFLGFRRDISPLLDDAAVAVQPSHEEGFPNSVVEFMAKAKPIIATAVAGTPEAVDDGVHGLLVPPGDVDALTRALARLLGDPSLGRRLGRAARTRAETEFGEELMIARVESLLRRMLC